MSKEADTGFREGATVADAGERKLIEAISGLVAAGTTPAPDIVRGIGDDCAVVLNPEGAHQILTTDLLIEGTHFLRNEATEYFDLGRRAATANISDIASMGGRPRHLLLSLGLPGQMLAQDAMNLVAGMQLESSRWGATLVGGDIASSPVLVINLAVTGTSPREQNLPLRSRCKPGQNVFVSGNLGGSMAGLHLLTRDEFSEYRQTPHGHQLIDRHQRPEPRVDLGVALASRFADLAMIDISDSLYNELTLLSRASAVGFQIDVSHVPASPELRIFCTQAGLKLYEYTLFSGEEYELLFTANVEEADLRTWLKSQHVTTPVRRIGTVCTGNSVELTGPDGEIMQVPDATFRHF